MTPDCRQEENVLQTFIFYSSNYIFYFLFNVAVFSKIGETFLKN